MEHVALEMPKPTAVFSLEGSGAKFNFSPIWQASDSLSPRAPESARRPFLKFAPEPPQQYLEAFPRFARAFGGGAIDHGTAHYYEGFSGVALWLPPGAAPDEESLVKVIEDTVGDERWEWCEDKMHLG